jgi:hypothetical protein
MGHRVGQFCRVACSWACVISDEALRQSGEQESKESRGQGEQESKDTHGIPPPFEDSPFASKESIKRKEERKQPLTPL